MIESEYKYDPRVTWIEDRYWITWCNGYYGPTIGVGYTFDFKEFFQCENALLPFNRNGVLFPQKINGKYALLSRPSDSGHTPFGDIYISYSPDMKFWGEHRHVLSPTPFPESAWQCTKIGAGPIPILTDEGLVALLPRRYHHLQRVPLLDGCRPARQGRPLEGALPHTSLPARPGRSLRAARRCAQRGIPLRRPA